MRTEFNGTNILLGPLYGCNLLVSCVDWHLILGGEGNVFRTDSYNRIQMSLDWIIPGINSNFPTFCPLGGWVCVVDVTMERRKFYILLPHISTLDPYPVSEFFQHAFLDNLGKVEGRRWKGEGGRVVG